MNVASKIEPETELEWFKCAIALKQPIDVQRLMQLYEDCINEVLMMREMLQDISRELIDGREAEDVADDIDYYLNPKPKKPW